MLPMFRPYLLLTILASMTCMACIDWQRQSIGEESIYERLSDRNISGLEQKLAHFERLGNQQLSVAFAKQWIYFSNCQPIPAKHDLLFQNLLLNAQKTAQSNPLIQASLIQEKAEKALWLLLSLQLKLEQYRHLEQALKLRAGRINTTQYLREIGAYRSWLDPSFFKKISDPLDQSLWAQWPKNEEGWPDEVPSFISIANQCASNGIDILLENAMIPSKPNWVWPFSLIFRAWDEYQWKLFWVQQQQLLLIDQMLTMLPTLKLESKAWLLWQWWLYDYQIQMYLRISKVDIGWPLHSQSKALESNSFIQLSSLLYYQKACQSIDQLLTIPMQEANKEQMMARQGMQYLKGICLLDGQQGHQQNQHTDTQKPPIDQSNISLSHIDLKKEALAQWKGIDIDLLDENQLILLQYHRLKYLTELQDWSACRQLESALPKASHPIYAPFVYLLGLAFDRSGEDDKFMAFSLKLFRDQSWRKDPFLRALFYLFVRKLTKLSFEGKVIELLEDLGDRRFTYERVMIFSEIALDEGDVDQAIESSKWLIAHHDYAENQPKYHSLLAFAYFLKNEPASFKIYLKKMIGITPQLLDAIPEGRRAQFFGTRDQALTQLLRLILPKIAELENITQKDSWLKLMIEEIQNFIRVRAESKAKEDLLSLYRIASQMLSSREARAYPEFIGKSRLPTLVLGEARLHAANLSPFEPRDLQWPLNPVWSLLMLPRNANPYTWTQAWIQPKERN